MELNLKSDIMRWYIKYYFSLNLEWVMYKNLGIECSKHWDEIITVWNNKPSMLIKAKNFREIENKLFSHFENEFNKNFNNKTI